MKINKLLSTAFMTVLPLSFTVVFATPTCGSTEFKIPSDALPWSKEQVQEISKRLTNDPLKLLNELKPYEKEIVAYINARASHKEPFEPAHLKKTIQTFSAKNPISLLSECDDKTCALSRNQSSSRAVYEKTVLEYLKKYRNQDRINLVSFASGGLFQDAVILAKAAQNQITNINIHMIDPKFEQYITMKNYYDSKNQSNNLADKIHEHCTLVNTKCPLQEQCEINQTINHEKNTQFGSLAKHLSDDKIQVYFHKNAAAYQEFCAKNEHLKADLITGIDFESGTTYVTSMIDYHSLLYHTLKKDGTGILMAEPLIKQQGDKSAINIMTKKEECSKEFLDYVSKSGTKILSSMRLSFTQATQNPEELQEIREMQKNISTTNQYIDYSTQYNGPETSTSTWKNSTTAAVASLLTLACYKMRKVRPKF